jgi:predicted nuclease with TOPRIM domain
MDDASIRDQIESLVAEEQRLLDEAEGQGPDNARHERLQELKVELDRCWDLLRQREAREEFALDPDSASVRDADTVEGYEQ